MFVNKYQRTQACAPGLALSTIYGGTLSHITVLVQQSPVCFLRESVTQESTSVVAKGEHTVCIREDSFILLVTVRNRVCTLDQIDKEVVKFLQLAVRFDN